MPVFPKFHKPTVLTKTEKFASLSVPTLEARVSDLIVILGAIALSIVVPASVVLYLLHRATRRNPAMGAACEHLRDVISGLKEGEAAVSLAMIANALTEADRTAAIKELVQLATVHNNREAFLAIRDHIKPEDLELTLWTHPSLLKKEGQHDVGDHQRKFFCVYKGFRTLQHLDTPFTEKEHTALRKWIHGDNAGTSTTA